LGAKGLTADSRPKGVLFRKAFLRFAYRGSSSSSGNGNFCSRRFSAPDRRCCRGIRFVHLSANPWLVPPPSRSPAPPSEAATGKPPVRPPVFSPNTSDRPSEWYYSAFSARPSERPFRLPDLQARPARLAGLRAEPKGEPTGHSETPPGTG
jgi:hypothetical protein